MLERRSLRDTQIFAEDRCAYNALALWQFIGEYELPM